MITLANETGDVRRNPVRLNTMEFKQENYWTAHFGGLYIFQSLDHPAVISSGPKEALGDLPIKYVFDLEQRNHIAKFLEYNDLVEPVVKARGVDGAAILKQKMDFILIDTIADQGIDLSQTSRRDMRRLARENAHLLPESYTALSKLVAWAEHGGAWPTITSDHPAYFYTLRAAEHGDSGLVNMLLAQLCMADIRQLFICHKELFYTTYAGWPETKKDYVARFLEREYQVDKAGARAALFGHEASMEMDTDQAKEDLIARVGPWGAVRRR